MPKRVNPPLLYVTTPHLTGKSKVTSKGGVVIPKEIRDELGIKPGDELAFSLQPPLPAMKQDKRLISIRVIRVPKSRAEAVDLFTGILPGVPGRSATELLVEEHRREVEEDERRTAAARKRRQRTSA